MTYISIHDATQEEYDRLNMLEDQAGPRIRWKKLIVGTVEITIFAPDERKERDAPG